MASHTFYPFSLILQSTMSSFGRMDASPQRATRMNLNLHGRGIQASNDGILYVRWVYDDRGNAWADCHGNRVFYVVPRCDFTLMNSAMRRCMPVTLIVRRDHGDYNYGEYLVTSILPYSSNTYRAELCRCDTVDPNNNQPRDDTGEVREGNQRHCIDTDVEKNDASHSEDDSMCGADVEENDASHSDDDSMCDADVEENDASHSDDGSDSDSDTDTDDESVNKVDGDRYLVERILGHRLDLGFGWEFHVAWRGYSERTWEPLRHMVHNRRVNTHFTQYCVKHELSRPMTLVAEMCE